MCRLLGVVSREPIALDQAVREEIEPFTELSEIHRDGWGVAWFESADGGHHPAPQILRQLDVARESAAYREALAAAHGPMMLVHLRKASPGLPLQITNTHPFREGDVVFAHNGQFDLSEGLREEILSRGGRTPEGTTDSELFFSLIELHARTEDPATAIQLAASEITSLCLRFGTRVPEALNCLYMTPDQLIAYQQSDPTQAKPHHDPDNYSLRYRVDPDRVIVASSGIPQPDYLELSQGDALVVDRRTLSAVVNPSIVPILA
ncbi:class II glutamine amidotransferase [Brachybacterium muris]|uniref:class II glutamine amidotransferase n=1 Tax=Brachybacterium muris TaxID=219301 RepID=UPI00223A85DE|nr:class II glutamine amidotransferase [Brachybacterium muris]MCT2295430.1 class II glutamine amidotransferase [Brachybacterium muris]